MRFIIISVFLLSPFCLQAQDAKPPAQPLVLLPGVLQTKPAPPADPPDPIKLSTDRLYVIRSSVNCLILTSPEGIVRATLDTKDDKETNASIKETDKAIKFRGNFKDGWLAIRAKFVDGDDSFQTRIYPDKEKNVWSIEVMSPGICEIIIVPEGGGVKDIVRRTIDTNTGPRPPPSPKPDPDPKPEPVVATKLYVVIIEETQQAAAGRGKLLTDPAIAARFKLKGHAWRIVDKDVVGPNGQPPADIASYLNDAKDKNLPRVYLVNPSGQELYSGDLPTTAPALLALIQKYGG